MSAEAQPIHRDDYGSKLGMWLFLVTEINLFGGLFIAYAFMRQKYPSEFHHASSELNATLGVTNTVVLLTSSLTVVLAIEAMKEGRRVLSTGLITTTVGLGLVFLVIKAFEWSAKLHHGIYPNSMHLATLPHGEQVFFGLYFVMTGLHGVHVLVGMAVLSVVARLVGQERITKHRPVALENGGLYWHLVDVIWIFLLPLFYLAA
jgi:cytochrome c oxidase subunit III